MKTASAESPGRWLRALTLAHAGVGIAATAGDRRSVRLAGLLGLSAGLGGGILMPKSPLWMQAIVCARIVRDSRLVAQPDTEPVR